MFSFKFSISSYYLSFIKTVDNVWALFAFLYDSIRITRIGGFKMRSLWSIDIDTLQLFYELIAKLEKDMERALTGQERELAFLQLMKSKDIKPSGNTELNKEEFIRELVSKNKKILNIDKDGIQIITKEKNDE